MCQSCYGVGIWVHYAIIYNIHCNWDIFTVRGICVRGGRGGGIMQRVIVSNSIIAVTFILIIWLSWTKKLTCSESQVWDLSIIIVWFRGIYIFISVEGVHSMSMTIKRLHRNSKLLFVCYCHKRCPNISKWKVWRYQKDGPWPW